MPSATSPLVPNTPEVRVVTAQESKGQVQPAGTEASSLSGTTDSFVPIDQTPMDSTVESEVHLMGTKMTRVGGESGESAPRSVVA